MVLEVNGEDKWSEKVTNEQVHDRIGEKRTILNNILRRKANWIGHILRRIFLLHAAIEGQMTEVKGVGRRITQLLDDLRNRILGGKETCTLRKLVRKYLENFEMWWWRRMGKIKWL